MKSKNAKELRKMGRAELLEILVAQSEEIDLLKEQLAEANQKLEARELACKEAGSLAELSARISGLFESAQQTADLYISQLKKAAEGEDQNERHSASDEN